MHTVSLALAFIVVVVASGNGQVPLADPSARRAALAGIIRDTSGRPLPFVSVSADGRDLSTVTDSSGRFHLGGIPAGPTAFSVMRIGYKAINFETNLPPDSTILIDIRMRSAQTLPGVSVVGQREAPRLARDGFYERQRVGWGKYLTPDEVDKMSRIVGTPAQLLRNMNGVRVLCGQRERQRTGGCVVQGGANVSCMAVFIDGVYTRGELDQNLGVGAVYAIEVYNRPAIVPMEFKHPATDRCGAIAVWTQSRRP